MENEKEKETERERERKEGRYGKEDEKKKMRTKGNKENYLTYIRTCADLFLLLCGLLVRYLC